MSPALHDLLASAELQHLMHAYCKAIDDNDPDAVAALFTDDCVYRTSKGRNGTTHGRPAVADRVRLLLTAFSATSHHSSNAVVRLTSPETAVGTSYLLAWHRFREPRPDGILWARYHDIFACTADGWRIAERTLRVHGQQDFAFGWLPPEPPRGNPDGSGGP